MIMLFKSLIKLIVVISFRTFLWALLTGNFTNINIITGIVLSIIIPLNDYKNLRLVSIIPSIFKTISLPYQMIKETIQIILLTKPKEVYVKEDKNLQGMRGSKLATFLDVLIITSTPMTIVIGEEGDQWRIHTLVKRSEQ